MIKKPFVLIATALVGLVLGLALQPGPVKAQTATRTIPASPEVVTLGSTSDTAATVGGTGSMISHFRRLTTQMNEVEAAVESLVTNGVDIDDIGGTAPIFSACLNSETRNTFEISEGAATTTIQLVAPAGGVRLYFCGGLLLAGGAATVTLTAGTGATCGTSTQTPMTFRASAANEYIFNANSDASFWRGDLGDGLCFTRSASVSLDGYLSFVLVSE